MLSGGLQLPHFSHLLKLEHKKLKLTIMNVLLEFKSLKTPSANIQNLGMRTFNGSLMLGKNMLTHLELAITMQVNM